MTRALRCLLCLLLIAVMLVGCGQPASNGDSTTAGTSPTGDSATEPTGPADLTLEERLATYAELGYEIPDDNYRTWYEIFVYSFCDTNGDGIGDLQGVISKLDYVKELGFSGIWLMPINPSPSYHKYNVDDYYAIDPVYGTMEDFDQLIAECDKRGIKVIIDLVVNHTGYNHPWFQEAIDYLRYLDIKDEPDVTECPEVEYYNFVKEGQQKGEAWRKVSGSNYYYEGQFTHEMPDLNWDSQAMREEIRKVMEFWLNKGVAGFRVDAAKEFYTGAVSKNVEVMSWLQKTATSIKPDAYMVAEVWEIDYSIITSYYDSGFTSIFNYPFGNSGGKLMQVLNGRGNPNMVKTWATALETATSAYAEKNPNFIDAPFLSNHDILRIYDNCKGDQSRIKLAGAMNLFMGGGTFVYYGEEIGMAGTGATDDDPSKRAPMYWNSSFNYGMTNPPPGCKLPSGGYTMGSAEEQMVDEGSVYSYYREAIAIRNALPMIARGVNTCETALNQGCVSALRKNWNGQECIILMNIDDDEAGAQVDLSAYADWKLVATLSVSDQKVTMSGSTLTLPAYGTAVLVPAN